VRLLLDTGQVDADARDTDGRTPLCEAAARGHEGVGAATRIDLGFKISSMQM
jgi:ankyrin repeat protein